MHIMFHRVKFELSVRLEVMSENINIHLKKFSRTLFKLLCNTITNIKQQTTPQIITDVFQTFENL
jgi:lipoate-protein ligase A